MKKYYFVSAIAALALASCANDDFLGEVPGNNPSAVTGKEISFSGEAGKTTRADGDKTGEQAAEYLKNNFIVFGCKTINDASQTVYDHYNVKWISNDTKWEYIGQPKNELNETATNQSIKYIIRKTKCFRILERNAIISKTKRNFSRLYPTPQKIKKNRPASPERNTFEGS